MSFKDKIFKNQSPWGSGPSGGNGNGSGRAGEPPNLDEIIKNIQKTINKFLSSVIQIKNHITNHNVQIIHAHMFHTLVIASIIKIFNKDISIVFTPHNSFQEMNIRRLVLWFLKPFRSIDTVFSKSAVSFFHKKL